MLKDITGKLQITVDEGRHPELVDTIDQLTPDSVITVTGKVIGERLRQDGRRGDDPR